MAAGYHEYKGWAINRNPHLFGPDKWVAYQLADPDAVLVLLPTLRRCKEVIDEIVSRDNVIEQRIGPPARQRGV